MIGGILSTTATVIFESKLFRQLSDSDIVTNTAKGTTDKIVKNSDGLHEVTINKTSLEVHERLNTPDLGGSGKLKSAVSASVALILPT